MKLQILRFNKYMQCVFHSEAWNCVLLHASSSLSAGVYSVSTQTPSLYLRLDHFNMHLVMLRLPKLV